jgi:hypothetical protein
MLPPSPAADTAVEPKKESVPAGCMPPWRVGDLPQSPGLSWSPRVFIGPGLMMVGSAIGGGEWLMGPAATARYGAVIMGFATISILCQVAYNLEVQRYTLYCGEPIFVGFFRMLPGPLFWTGFYIFVDFFAIWPYLVANAAILLHAALLGHMPTEAERAMTPWVAYGIFLLALVPLIFGGKIYNSLEKLMVAKIVLVLGYLLFLGFFFVSWDSWVQIFAGFIFLGKDAQGDWGFRLLPVLQAGQQIDWALLAAFAAIAGVGGLNNSQLSTYARDKGWGMGARVGAIPSMVGGRGIALSHTGKVFPLSPESLGRWRGWMRFIRRDQLMIWAVGCVLGMAIPSLLSFELLRPDVLRGVTIKDAEVPAATAQALMNKYHVSALWFLTLLCGFLVLWPSQISTMDGLVRRWTDVLWTGNRRLQRLEGHQVKYVYYTLLGVYALWGLFVLTWLRDQPLVMVKVSGVLMNFALGFSAFHTLAVNTRLLPRELRPGWFMRVALLACGLFFIGISALGMEKAVFDLEFTKDPQWLRRLLGLSA